MGGRSNLHILSHLFCEKNFWKIKRWKKEVVAFNLIFRNRNFLTRHCEVAVASAVQCQNISERLGCFCLVSD